MAKSYFDLDMEISFLHDRLEEFGPVGPDGVECEAAQNLRFEIARLRKEQYDMEFPEDFPEDYYAEEPYEPH